MKTYILRDQNPVEPQKPDRPCRPEIAPTIPAPPAATPPGPILFVGLDVHNDSIAVSLAPSDNPEVRRYGIIGGQHKLSDPAHGTHGLQQRRDGRALQRIVD